MESRGRRQCTKPAQPNPTSAKNNFCAFGTYAEAAAEFERKSRAGFNLSVSVAFVMTSRDRANGERSGGVPCHGASLTRR